MPAPSSPPDDSPPPRPKRRRRWTKVLVILLVLLAVAAFVANGPGARWLVGKVLRDQLAKQGLDGEVAVDGHLWSGFTLRDVRFTGEEALEVIRFENLGVRYRLPDLRNKQIEGLFGKDIEVIMHAAPRDDDEEEEADRGETDLDAIAGAIRDARALALPVALDFEGISFTLRRPDADPLTVALDSLRHESGSETFTIGAIRSNALGDEALAKQDLSIEWRDESLVLSRFDILADLALESLAAHFPEGGTLGLSTTVIAADSRFIATLNEDGRLTAELTGDTLDLQPLADRFAPDLGLAGTVRQLQLEADGLGGPRDGWTASLSLASGPVTLADRQFPALTASASIGDRLEVTVSTPAAIELTVQSRDDDFGARAPADWFRDLPVWFQVGVPGIHDALREAAPAVPMELPDLATIPNGAVTTEGTLTIGGPRGVDAVDATWSTRDIVYRGQTVPPLAGTAKLFGDLVEAEAVLAAPRPNESLTLGGQFNLEAKAYKASAAVTLPDPAWLNPLIPGDEPLWRPAGPIALTWDGEGQLNDQSHRGSLAVTELSLLAPEATTAEIRLEAAYDWPQSLQADSLSLRNGDLWLEGSAGWNDERLTIPALRLHDETGLLASVTGGSPLAATVRSLEDFLRQDGALALGLKATDLRLERLASLLPLPKLDGYEATLSADLTLGGTPGTPTVAGSLRAREVRLPAPENLPVIAARLDLATKDRQLTATGEVTEPGGRLVELNASLPLRLRECLEDPDRFRSLPLAANATVSNFSLGRLQAFVPQLAEAEGGTLDAEVSLSGPLAEPRLVGNASVRVSRYPLPGTPYREVTDAELLVRLDEERIVVDPSRLTVAGGMLKLSGTVDSFMKEPVLDLRLGADQALLWRDENVKARANAALTLRGPVPSARLAGTIDIVESIFYKDIEIIPFGAPAASAPEPKLPKVGRKKRGNVVDLPAPFADWTLDLRVRTKDKFLIRGNLAEGSATGDVSVTGTLSNPRPDGQIVLRDVEAELPFSSLEVKRGVVTMRPNAPLDPAFEIRGTSTVQSHLIQLYLYGSLTDPKYSLVSSPPLPEAEILTLLATGTTIGDLNDPQLAQARAFQLLLGDLRLKAAQPDANPLLRALRPVLNSTRNLDLRVGDNDPFSGRQYTSGTFQVGEHWFATIQIDALGNSRGLIRYSTRSTR